MKIKEISTEQFAGIRDMSIPFADGLNLVIGRNESGKSTLVELLYHILFQKTKLHKTKDKDFISKYFPTQLITGTVADSIDGTVVFETDRGIYQLTKEWNGTKDSSCRLIYPDDSITRVPETISEVLREQLKYGEGIYNEIIFTPQNLQNAAIVHLLNVDRSRKHDVKQEILSTVTRAVMETGGVSIEKAEQFIAQKITEYGGRWDDAAGEPENGKHRRGIDNQWKAGVGIVLHKYYERETARRDLENEIRSEEQLENIHQKYKQLQNIKKEAQEEYEELNSHKAAIKNKELLEQSVHDNKNKLKKMELVVRDWPEKRKNIERAEALSFEYRLAAIRGRKNEAEEITEKAEVLESRRKELGNIRREDVEKAERLEASLMNFRGQLAGMNIRADLKMLDDYTPEVTAVSDGHTINTTDGSFLVNEAVKVTVPGVMEMTLSPADTDIGQIKRNIEDTEKERNEIYVKYGVGGKAALQQAYQSCVSCTEQIEKLREQYMALLDGDTPEHLNEMAGVPDASRSKNEISEEIKALCGETSVETFIGGMKALENSYKEDYGSPDNLENAIKEIQRQINKSQSQIEAIRDIPEKYSEITDFDAELQKMKHSADDAERRLASCRDELEAARSALSGRSAEDLREVLNDAEEEFAEARETYHHWLHIAEVFNNVKEESLNNPLADIQEHFEKYLDLISDGNEALKEMDDRMEDVRITSGDSYLSYDILSEGTKGTISLAFRLAVLEHLYPEGGGLVVFDDPLTDMDEYRKKAACTLIRQFAEKNQVIFVTCSSEYEDQLPGNVIRI